MPARRRTSVYRAHRKPSPRLRARALIASGTIVVLAIAFVVVQLVRPVPRLRFVPILSGNLAIAADGWAPPFANGPQQAFAVAGIGTVATSGTATPLPIASVTKLMSALVVLHDHPLGVGESGPTIVVTPADVASYRSELAAQDSVVAVSAGERLSELQALEAALIPSADNVINMLARWDAGSIQAFVAKMNAEAARLGLSHTHYADASGVDPASQSTAVDQLRVGEVAMENPVIASIVAMPQVTLPVAGLQYNVDGDLGTAGVIGVKTGWVPQGGASFVVAARRSVGTSSETVIGAIVGDQATPALPSALSLALRLVRAVSAALRTQHLVAAGSEVASIVSGRGQTVPVVATRGASFLVWPGATVARRVVPDGSLGETLRSGQVVATLELSLGAEHAAIPLAATGTVSAPSLGWRLSRL